jgi:tetratricopeptide (TPR) repeat protein
MRLVFCFFMLCFVHLACVKNARDQKTIPSPPVQPDSVKLAASISALSEVIKNNPSVADNYYKRAILNLKAEAFDDALTDINRADKLKPNKAQYYFVKSQVLKNLGDKKALGFALNAEALDFEEPGLYVLLGELFTQAGNYGKADEYFKRAESIYPKNGDLDYHKGVLAAKRGDTLNATRLFYSAISLKPQVFTPYDQLIKIYNKKRYIDSALVINEMAIKRFPLKKEMIFNKAQILENTGLLDSARIVYEQYLQVNPSKTEVLANIGSIYFRKKNFPAALSNFEKLIAASPENAAAYHMAGKCKEGVGDLDRAREYYEKSLKYKPDDYTVKNDLARVNAKIQSTFNVITPF